jgi:hypothetical protein
MTVTLVRDKETKNTIRFVTGNPGDEVTGSLYIRKDSELAKETEIKIEILEEVYQDVV